MTTTMSDADRAAFEAWYASERKNAANHMEWDDWRDIDPDERDNYFAAWQAALAYAREGISEQTRNDEPRNVDGKTRAEFESYLRTCYQHDNVRAQERGLGPKWPKGEIGLTPEDEREIAERVERSYPTHGTFACPICGKDVPHEHSAEDIVAHRNKQKACATPPQSNGLTDALEVLREIVAADDEAIAELKVLGMEVSQDAWKLTEKARAIIAALQPTAEPGKEGDKTISQLSAEVEGLRAVCAAAYQMAGILNAPARFLDALLDAAEGELEVRVKTTDLLPINPAEAGAFSEPKEKEGE